MTHLVRRGYEFINNPPKLDIMGVNAELYAKCAPKDFKTNYRIGAVTLTKKGLIGAYNSRKTHPIQKYLNFDINPHRIHLHAEIALMIKCKWKAKKIVVVRLTKTDKWAMAKPCLGCQRALKGVEVWYSTGNGEELKKLI